MNVLNYKQLKYLGWELLYPNRFWLLGISILLFLDFVLHLASGSNFRTDNQTYTTFGFLNEFFYVSAFAIAMQITAYTEFNSRRQRKGFPARLFTLPVPTLILFSVPVFLSLVLIETVFLLSHAFGGSLAVITDPNWVTLKIAVFMLNFQMIMWSMEKFGSIRLVFIGIAGFILVILSNPESELVFLVVWATITFCVMWRALVVKRSGGGAYRTIFTKNLLEIGDRVTAWPTRFSSAQNAQLWFEWRRAGFLLPLSVLTILLFVITPLSIFTRDYQNATSTILLSVFLLPIVLAIPVGMGFSKAEPWSESMDIPAFMLVRPLSSYDFIVIKLKAAAFSVLISWGVTLVFLFLWIPLWANRGFLVALGTTYWDLQGHSIYPQIALVLLTFVTGVLITWRFMISGLWIGLSKHRKLFTASAVPPILFLFFGISGLYELLQPTQDDFTRLPVLVWILGLAVTVKFWLAAWSWQPIDNKITHKYLLIWALGTSLLITWSILVWKIHQYIFGFDVYLFQSFLIFAALIAMPLAQIPLAPRFLEANRHR